MLVLPRIEAFLFSAKLFVYDSFCLVAKLRVFQFLCCLIYRAALIQHIRLRSGYGAKPRTSSAASEKRTSTSTSRPTSAGAKPYSQVKETAPKASKPQNPVNTPVQPDPRMPLLKKRALLISELESATGLFNIFKRMRLKREIRAVEDKLNDYS